MSIVIADTRGRVTLGSGLVEEYGRKFALVRMPKEIILIPVPKNPFKSLREQGRKLPPLSPKYLKKIAEEKALKEAKRIG